ncbi:MAG: mandelate racemase/muconate lactonizing enzyme family protein [Candidimonas sp.]|nr:MAG: mandelate racemase/muconate lactonizing enzyme family protein [Candidimonas sp.]TAM19083.1 MAG: mandelate racemase/muconate lactonizing enzyme family protein [Candidimonas sp.]TAM80705.1 MAG: mandelate racemase/muconate lactonizing enzyme family protein [Candidimonas sp.]
MFVFPYSLPVHLAKVDALVYRAPIVDPVQTSFGTMYDRPAVLVRLEDREGMVGWGEIWCNFPSVGAEHRARMLESCIAPVLLEQAWAHPTHAFNALSQRLAVLAIQSGEPGTIAQAIAGADIALWDLAAKRLGQPLWNLFGGTPKVHTYASGLSPVQPEKLAAIKHGEGYRSFKLKVGFGTERDMANLRALREMFEPDTVLMIDANQAWTPEAALDMSRKLAQFNPIWMEEPIRADHALTDWQRLAQASPIALAAGENMRSTEEFSAAIDSGAFAVIQPDLGKWGGFSGCVPVARRAIDHSQMFCPHWLGGGVGLIASMQLKAIMGHPGYVEVDSNPNPLRDLFAAPYLRPDNGIITLPDLPGLGITPDTDTARSFLVKHR